MFLLEDNGVAGQNGGSIGNGSFCVSGSGTMSKCIDITGVVIEKAFHKGSCGLGENNNIQEDFLLEFPVILLIHCQKLLLEGIVVDPSCSLCSF